MKYSYPYDYDEFVFCPVEDRPHRVYRLFDDAGRLLYIGCTRDLNLRLYMHDGYYNATSIEFKGLVARVESVEYENKAAARDAERKAIQAEAPLFNKAHNKGRHITRERYDEMAALPVATPIRRRVTQRALDRSLASVRRIEQAPWTGGAA